MTTGRRLVAIADDLSGAAETAAALDSRTTRSHVVLVGNGEGGGRERVDGERVRRKGVDREEVDRERVRRKGVDREGAGREGAAALRPPDPGEAIVLDLDSRYRPAAEAAEAVRDALRLSSPGGDTLVLKKIDSLLRGNLAAEVAALAEDGAGVVLAPALPVAGRVVRSGVVHIDGVALHEGDTWRSETTPAPRSIADALGGLPTTPIPLTTVRASGHSLLSALRTATDDGRVAVCDAETDADLTAIVEASLAAGPRLRLVGSGGLALALGRHLAGAPAATTPSTTAPSATAPSPATAPPAASTPPPDTASSATTTAPSPATTPNTTTSTPPPATATPTPPPATASPATTPVPPPDTASSATTTAPSPATTPNTTTSTPPPATASPATTPVPPPDTASSATTTAPSPATTPNTTTPTPPPGTTTPTPSPATAPDTTTPTPSTDAAPPATTPAPPPDTASSATTTAPSPATAPDTTTPTPPPATGRHVLVVVGTAEPAAVEQIRRLVEDGATHHPLPLAELIADGPPVRLPPMTAPVTVVSLAAPAGPTGSPPAAPDPATPHAPAAAPTSARGPLPAATPPSGGGADDHTEPNHTEPGHTGPGTRSGPVSARRLVHGLARAVAVAVAAHPGAVDLVLTGGETARRVLDALAVTNLAPVGQVHHGAVHLSTPDGRSVVTRPGSFGYPDSLRHIVRALRPHSTERKVSP
ncbi:four-carbon acid sugar kinase family protein [Streptomyces sp. NPDC044780]|uniref:four-carbon acid sugar kinase family protein n=1 Tax=unclassified Streptomyces TaxID=2593676 RepID=UPI0033E72545